MLGAVTRGKGSDEFGIEPSPVQREFSGSTHWVALGRFSFIYMETFSLDAESLKIWGMSIWDI